MDELDRLKEGLYLENTNRLLPWGADRQQLIDIYPPASIRSTAAWEVLTWRSPVVLGGIAGQLLEINLAPGDRFEQTWVWLERGESESRALDGFNASLRKLDELFGGENQPLTEALATDQVCSWETPDVEIGLLLHMGPEFADYSYSCQLSLRTKRLPLERTFLDDEAPS